MHSGFAEFTPPLPSSRALEAGIVAGRTLRETVMLINGKCHCGNISFVLDWRPEPTEIVARACSCTFCVKHGGLWTSCPSGTLRVKIDDPGKVSPYAFGTRTAAFHVCTSCGVAPVVSSRIEGHLYAVVSVNAFEGVDPALLRRAPATFDGETEEGRLARRQRNWIGTVEIAGSPA
jgi:hypothetical protein